MRTLKLAMYVSVDGERLFDGRPEATLRLVDSTLAGTGIAVLDHATAEEGET